MQRCPLLRVVIDLCLGAQEGAVRLSGAGKKKSLLCDSFLLFLPQSFFLSFVNSVRCHGPRHAAEDKHVISVCMLRLTASNEGKFVWEISNFWYHIMALRSMRSPH